MKIETRIAWIMKCLCCRLLNRTVTIESRAKRGKDDYMVKRSVSCSLEPVLNASCRVILAIGLIVALVNLTRNMTPIALMQLSKSCDDCMAKAIDMTNRLEAVSGHLYECSEQLDEMGKGFNKIESRLHVTTNLIKECSVQMDKVTNGLDKMESVLRKFEQRPFILRTEGCGNCWCNCCFCIWWAR